MLWVNKRVLRVDKQVLRLRVLRMVKQVLWVLERVVQVLHGGFCDSNYPVLISSLMKKSEIRIFFLKMSFSKFLFVMITFTGTFI